MRFLLPLLLFFPADAALAAVSQGGEWSLIRSAAGAAGHSGLRGGESEAALCVGEPFGREMSGIDHLLSGYLSQVPLFSRQPYLLQIVSTGAAVADDGSLTGVRVAEPVSLVFSNEMSTETVPEALTLTLLYDRTAAAVGAEEPFTLPYSSETESFLLRETSGDWPRGAIFRISVSNAAVDIEGAALEDASESHFSTVRDNSVENVVVAVDNPNAKAVVPPGVFSGDYSMSVSTGPRDAGIVRATEKLAALGDDRKLVSLLRVNAYDAQGQPVAGGLNGQVELMLPYADSQSDDVVDGTAGDIRTKTLSVWRLDEDASLWVRQGTGRRESSQQRVTYRTDRFSVYSLIGQHDLDVSNVYAFPVPFRPNANDPARYGSWETGITFTNLPSNGTIRIYTIAGGLVRELAFNTVQLVWDAKNSAGRAVASGLYIWEVRAESSRKTGKLVVAR